MKVVRLDKYVRSCFNDTDGLNRGRHCLFSARTYITPVNSFVLQQVCVSGDLAPFDEVSVAFRGPLNLYNIAWYEGTADETLERTTTWTPGYVDIDAVSLHTVSSSFL